MPKIKAAEKQSFIVTNPIEEVYAAFADPHIIKDNIVALDKYEIAENGDARWILREKNEKGVRFLGDYTVRYEGNGKDRVNWKSIAGNVDNDGEIILSPVANGIKVDYSETIAPDLPIPSLLAKVFRPIVAREVRKDIEAYIENVKNHLSQKAKKS